MFLFDLGGGALLTHVHELDMALNLFGEVRKSSGISSPLTTLGIQTDEFSAVNLLHSSGVISSITLDLAQICPSRSINVTFEHGSLFCDLLTNKLFVKQENNSSEHLIDSYDINESYLLQSKSFLNIDHTYENNLCSLEEAIIIQQIISDIQLNA